MVLHTRWNWRPSSNSSSPCRPMCQVMAKHTLKNSSQEISQAVGKAQIWRELPGVMELLLSWRGKEHVHNVLLFYKLHPSAPHSSLSLAWGLANSTGIIPSFCSVSIVFLCPNISQIITTASQLHLPPAHTHHIDSILYTLLHYVPKINHGEWTQVLDITNVKEKTFPGMHMLSQRQTRQRHFAVF